VTTIDRLAGLAMAAAATVGLTWLSQVPVESGTNDGALLRLAWRARPERIEHCVTQSPEALAALPPHMRQTTICEGINASYRLEVRRDDEILAERLVQPGGLRRDRPLYVFLEIPVPVGEANLSIRFERIEEASGGGDDPEGNVSRGALREAVPSSLHWGEPLRFEPRQVRVISYDPERRALFEVGRE
jgi:hypothetical protein